MGVGANAYRTDRVIVTLCGSMRFWDQMVEVARSQTMVGAIVLAPFVDLSIYDEADEDKLRKKKMLDSLHFEKIDLSSKVIVVMVDNYIGESTQKEISHAAAEGKKIEFRNFPTVIGNTGATVNQPKEPEADWKLRPEQNSMWNDKTPGKEDPDPEPLVTIATVQTGKVFANGVEVDPETMRPV